MTAPPCAAIVAILFTYRVRPRTSVFEGLEAVFAGTARQLDLAEGEILYRQSEQLSFLWFLESGYVKRLRVDADGGQRILGLLNGGKLLGLEALSTQVAAETIRVKTAARLLRLPVTQFKAGIARHDLQWTLLDGIVRQKQQAEKCLESLQSENTRTRLVRTLNELISHHGGRCQHGHEIDIPLTQEELAQLVGASRQVVSGLLNDLRREGVLDYGRGYICLNMLRVAS